MSDCIKVFHLILDYLLTCIHLCESLFVFQTIFLPCHIRLITLLLRWMGRSAPYKPGLTTPSGCLLLLQLTVLSRSAIVESGFCHRTESDLLLFLFRWNCGNYKQHNSKLGAIELREPRKGQHLQLWNFVYSTCKLVVIELMQQYREINLSKMTRTCSLHFSLALEAYRSDTCLVRVLPGIYEFMVGWLSTRRQIWFEVPFSLQFVCFDSCFCDCESFSLLLESQHPLSEIFSHFR